MQSPLRILCIEDDPTDAELIGELLGAAGLVCEIKRVDTECGMRDFLAQASADLILADYTLPSFDGMSALRVAKSVCPDVPFLFVSGTLGEEVAIEALRNGATDYVLKTGMAKLVPAVFRALRESREIADRKQADEKLRRSEAYLAEAQRLSRTGSFGWHVPTGKIYWSAETFRIFGYDQAGGVTIEQIMERTHPDDRADMQQVVERASREKTMFDFEHRLLMPDNSVRYVRVVGRPFEDADGLQFVGAVINITERKRNEEALRRSESYLAEAQRLTHTGSFVWQVPRRDSIYFSDEWYRIYEFDPAEGKPDWEKRVARSHPADRDRWVGAVEQAIRNRSDYDVEFRLLLPDQRIKFVHSIGHPILNSTGEVIQFVGITADISERKQAEAALRRSEGYLAEAQRLAQSGSWAWDVRTREVFWSQGMFRILQYDPDKIKPTLWDFFARVHPEDRPEVEERANLESTQKDRVDPGSDFRVVLPDGTIRHFHSIAHPVVNESGEITEVFGTTMDVTESKLAEEALRRNEASLLEAQRLSHTGSWTHDVLTGKVTVSPELRRIFDAKPDDNMSATDFFRDRIHPEDWPDIAAKHEKALAAKADFESDYRIVLPDGSIKYIHNVGHPKLGESGELLEYVGTTIDVTEQHEARQALQTAFEQIKALKDQLYNENIALREEIDRSSMFEEIVGESPALQAVLAHVVKVAPAESTVLVTGETGTGKELIARAIHKRSHRASRAFVSVNCAAIPTSLIASELFGHEKGAFTGATQRRLGRFELAEGGTIFLDEIGELPSDVQIALLRVLQEREFERVGGERVIRANVRVIAATNRNLQAAIEAGTFRQDLYYRLNVFPIEMPPLRKRKEDIPLLVEYFIDRYATKTGKKIRGISRATLERLAGYAWPGNIRELQNVIERSVIVCETETFSIDESWLSSNKLDAAEPAVRPILKMSAADEKKVIETALADAQGRVSGPSGAAAKLGVPASTLDSKIKALKINKHRFKSA